MADRDRFAFALQLAGHVHEATEVARKQQVRAGCGNVVGLLADDHVRDRRIFDAERAAEPAANFGVPHFPDLESLDGSQQLAGLPLDAELAQPRAGVVIGRAAPIACRNGLNPEHVHQKRDELEGLRRECFRPRQPVGIFAE